MLAALQELFEREAAVYRKQGFANDDMFADDEDAETQQGVAPASGAQQQQRQPAQAGACSLMLSPAAVGPLRIGWLSICMHLARRGSLTPGVSTHPTGRQPDLTTCLRPSLLQGQGRQMAPGVAA